MSVGIYMPARNVEKYIDESIKSIISQTYTNWNIYILDDSSDDQTYEMAKNYECDKISVNKRKEHCGKIGKLKNECIQALGDKHEFICHVGSDDMIPTNALQTFVEFMDNNKEIGVCCGNFICFNDQGNKWAFPHVAQSGDFDSSVLLRYMSLFPLRFYRRTIIEQVGGYSNELTSAVDYDLALKVDEVTKIQRIKDPISYYYRQHSEQVSTKARPEQNSNAKQALQDALKRRNIDGKIKNDQPPFVIDYSKSEESSHFIWGKK